MKLIKYLKKILPLILLGLSWLALLMMTNESKPWYIFSEKPSNVSASVPLGEVSIENYDKMGFTKGLVEYVPSNDTWLVGTDKGEILDIDQSGKVLWKRSLGTGKLISLALSKDHKTAYVGEQSASGQLYALEIATGEILWKYNSSELIGTQPEKRSLPGVMHIVVDKQGNIYFTAYRFLMNADSSREYFTRVVALNPSGQMLWKYPQAEIMDSWVNWCTIDDDKQIAVSTAISEIKANMKYQDSIYILDRSTGNLITSKTIPPVAPFANTVMRSSPNFDQAGKLLAASTSDGRGLLLNSSGEVLWTRNLSKPQLVESSWINASGRDAYIFDFGVIFTTINTFNRDNWQLPTPVEHPGDNSVFLFDTEGNFKYKTRFSGTVEQLTFNKGLIACAIGRNVRTHNYKVHGVAIIDAKTGEKNSFFHSAGPTQAVAISSDNKKIAAIEAGAVTPEGEIIGAYRLNIYTVE